MSFYLTFVSSSTAAKCIFTSSFIGLLILILNVEVACLFFTRHEEYVENDHIIFVSAKREEIYASCIEF